MWPRRSGAHSDTAVRRCTCAGSIRVRFRLTPCRKSWVRGVASGTYAGAAVTLALAHRSAASAGLTMTAVTLPTRSRPWLAPLAGALAYPLFLRSAYGSMRMWTEASSGTERFAAMLMVVASLLAGYAVPLIAAFSVWRIARDQAGTTAAIRAYRFAHLVFAVPPLFTLMGVL